MKGYSLMLLFMSVIECVVFHTPCELRIIYYLYVAFYEMQPIVSVVMVQLIKLVFIMIFIYLNINCTLNIFVENKWTKAY